jgi:hypothetical protein
MSLSYTRKWYKLARKRKGRRRKNRLKPKSTNPQGITDEWMDKKKNGDTPVLRGRGYRRQSKSRKAKEVL